MLLTKTQPPPSQTAFLAWADGNSALFPGIKRLTAIRVQQLCYGGLAPKTHSNNSAVTQMMKFAADTTVGFNQQINRSTDPGTAPVYFILHTGTGAEQNLLYLSLGHDKKLGVHCKLEEMFNSHCSCSAS